MKQGLQYITASAVLAAGAISGPAFAQESSLTSMPMGQLKGELQSRYDNALTISQNPDVLKAQDSVFQWALETKVQCAIAIGFTKSNTRDPESIRKCMIAQPAPPVVIPDPEPPKEQCQSAPPFAIFFDWDSDIPPADAQAVIAQIANNKGPCNWGDLTVVGHTDRSGPDSYNDPLSIRRANAVAELLRAAGIPDSQMSVTGRGETDVKVETADGERNPTNRRVEVNTVTSGR